MDDNKKISASKKASSGGEDAYRKLSLRIKDETVAQLDELAAKTNRSRNKIINMLLDFAIADCEIEE